MAERGITTFINADLIAAGLSPFAPELAARMAGRLMLEEIDRCGAAGSSFAFETTLAGKTYGQRIRFWQASGYSVKLIVLQLPSVEQAVPSTTSRPCTDRWWTNGKRSIMLVSSQGC